MMNKRTERFDTQLAKEKAERLPKLTRIALLTPLCLHISFKALDLVHQQPRGFGRIITVSYPDKTSLHVLGASVSSTVCHAAMKYSSG